MKKTLLVLAIVVFISCDNCEEKKERIWNNYLQNVEAMGDNPNMEQLEAMQRERERDLADACD